MKKTIANIMILLTVLAAGSCTKHILEKVNFNGLPGDEVWADTTQANLYLNSLYNVVMPVWPCNESSLTFPSSFHNTTDESNGGTTALLQGKLTSESVGDFFPSTSQGAYFYIRRINILFANIDNFGLKPSQTAVIKAQAYFLRAYLYFDLIKHYGGVPYITSPEDWLTDSLNVARTSTSNCIDSLVADLNHCSILPASWPATDFGRITRGAALAFKARVLLTWASPQFNPQNDMSRWQQAYTVAKNAYDTCTLDGYALYSRFGGIFTDITSNSNHEPMIFRPLNGTNVSGQYETYDAVTRPFSQTSTGNGQTNNPTWNLVTAFPMKDGAMPTDPLSPNHTVAYDSIYYWKNRDPRFYQTISYNGSIYGLGNTPGRKEWTYTNYVGEKSHATTTGFYCRKNIDTTLSKDASQFGKTFWVEMRFAEVMMNYAECANMTGDQGTAYTMLENIRKRAGISANGDGLYGLAKGMSQDSMQKVILNEREVEFAFEGKRYDDLRRTRTFDKLNNTFRMQLVLTLTSAGANLEKTNPTTGGLFVDTVDVNSSDYTKFWTRKLVPIASDVAINFLPTYYAYAIPSSNISKEPAMQQTIGWLFAGGMGTFDPTK